MAQVPEPGRHTPEEMYLDLLKKCLTRYAFGEPYHPVWFPRGGWRSLSHKCIRGAIRIMYSGRPELVRRVPFDAEARAEGRDWPAEAETMIGLKRLGNLQHCAADVLRRGVPGDLMEAGVWRGGATIFMRALLAVYGDANRVVWVADSFRGLPKPDAEHYPADLGDRHWTFAPVVASLDEVKANFSRYGLLDDRVRFLPGWFNDTLPTAPVERLAVLRLDGDMYESTIVALRALYPKLSVGGYLIIDDYSNTSIRGCKLAVDDFRKERRITEEIVKIDWTGIFWQKAR
jgi:O-methyltransferase